MGDFTKRLATASVLVPAVLVAIFADPSPWSVVALAAAVALFGYDEYLRMALPVTPEHPAWAVRTTGGAVAVAIVVLPSVFSPALVIPPLLTLGVVALGLVVLTQAKTAARPGQEFGVCVAGLAYVPLLLSVLPLLKGSGQGNWLTVALCMAFFSDTAAYLAGRAFGRHKLYPAVSPGKTWEGAAGGIAGSCVATVGVGSLWLLPELPLSHALLLGILGSICGQIGDLVESMLKRSFGVKDSGKLLPGHGGMLDRVDGLLFVAPVAYYYVTLVASS